MSFQLHPDFLQTASGAQFSDCRKYRYLLWRRWEGAKPHAAIGNSLYQWEPTPARAIAFIGLNPSTADETQDDPTIRICRGMAQRLEFDAMVMLNLFAFRATDPKAMKAAVDPVGPGNGVACLVAMSFCDGHVFCWGNHGGFKDRSKEFLNIQLQTWRPLCWGVNANGEPKHPLYQPASAKLVPYSRRGTA